MQYDPIKRSLGVVFNRTPFLRILFYKLLDTLLLRTWHLKRELKKLKKTSTSELQVLDAGAGFGQYSYFLSQLAPNWKVTAVDVKQEQIDDCNQFFAKIGKKNQVRFKYADLTEFEDKNMYNLIITIDVMEHILLDEKVFANFHSSLKPNGMVLITTPSDQGGSEAHDEHEHSFIDEHVRNGYNIFEIEQKLKRAGFTKVEARYTYGKTGHLSWLLSMKYPIIMLNMSKLFFVILPFYYLLFFPFCFLLNYFDVRTIHRKGTGLLVKAYK